MPAKRSDKSQLSQHSSGSDDAGIMAVVAQQMQSSWEKSRKEKEAKFFQEAKAGLNHWTIATSDEYSRAIAEMNGIYEKFVSDYAAVEDDIRKIWVQLLKEQQTLLVLAEKKHKHMIESDKEREKGQVQGMAIAKKAMEGLDMLL
ncbi:hypothetical protein B0H21DRAFT_235023 [Amylocystis lapponica]|nr:hypothetical protein B0H21DRAFT_235023 [Amylocystis lapponica]